MGRDREMRNREPQFMSHKVKKVRKVVGRRKSNEKVYFSIGSWDFDSVI